MRNDDLGSRYRDDDRAEGAIAPGTAPASPKRERMPLPMAARNVVAADPVAALRGLRDVRAHIDEALDAAEAEAVRRARSLRPARPFHEIARALAISKSEAHRRFSGRAGDSDGV